MLRLIKRYTKWLHTRWPAGTVERLPEVNADGSTNVPGLYIVGDLTGIPLLKFSADTGARAVQTILADPSFTKAREQGNDDIYDLAIIGGGVSGMSAALEAKKQNLRYILLEAAEPFSTIVNFPKGKPIYTYPTDMTPAGDMRFRAEVKEPLVDELHEQTLEKGIEPILTRAERIVRKSNHLEVVLHDQKNIKARRAIVGIGRSGNFRKLSVPGEDKDKVYNRLHDPSDYCDQQALVVGGGDSALETAIALAQCGAQVTLSYRKPEFSRPKPDNIDKLNRFIEDPGANVDIDEPVSERVTTSAGSFMGEARKKGSINLMMSSRPLHIDDESVAIQDRSGKKVTIQNDAVFSMIGREPPLDFFRRSGVRINGEWRPATWMTFITFMIFCTFIYNWKAGGWLTGYFQENHWFPFNLKTLFAAPIENPITLTGTIAISLTKPGFYYTLVYCLCVIVFGVRRIRRRKTPYITMQTTTLMIIQTLPLFLLPYILLPWAGHNGWFDSGLGQWLGDQLFPKTEWDAHGREYWRAFGFILAWPLFIWNFLTDQPMHLWLAIGFIQTFVIIPLIIYRWGKGAYCGWICSCGALAETLGDAHRHKMPHGPLWNRVNFVGQAVLLAAFVLLLTRIIAWTLPHTAVGGALSSFYGGLLNGWRLFGIPLNYYWLVDIGLAGIIGVGFYFWFSGRVWCRFACPLAALMHIYTRFSRFRIFADKKKCISCNVCTSVCHQGIDIMNFANKGLPMEDPQCVRCSACVQSCPTGVLTFGQIDRATAEPLVKDKLRASPVQIREYQKIEV